MRRIRKKYENNAIDAYISEFKTEKGITEYHILLTGTIPLLSFHKQLQNIQNAYQKIVSEELTGKAVPVFLRYFLSDAANQAHAVRAVIESEPNLAFSIVEQPPLNGTKIALWGWIQTNIQPDSTPKGITKVKHHGYTQYWCGNGYAQAANSEEQTRLVLNNYIQLLKEEECCLADNCIRTWLFVQNVDVNYAGVVKARREVFTAHGLTEHTHYIASTGIEGRHEKPDIFVQMDAYAVKGIRQEQIQFLHAYTHLNPTYEYGVTFERGTAVTYGDRKHIFISGTASIDNQGQIVHPYDIEKQTERMFENVSVLLKEAGAEEKEIMQAIIYLRDASDYTTLRTYMEIHHPYLPCIMVHAPVCRPGWLIEMECIAVTQTEQPEYPTL